MDPFLNPVDILLFYKYLDNATFYLEFGGGGSTYQATLRPNIKEIHVVESDPYWLKKLQTQLYHKNIHYHFCDVNTKPNTGGNPGPLCTVESMKNYSDQIYHIKNSISHNVIDFILIDGRFRVACALKCFNVIDENCIIAFDDYHTRPQYHIISNYYTIIDTNHKSMVILKKKNVPPPIMIHNYECIPD